MSRHRLHGLHADAVDVGPLLAVDFDVDELLVHDRGGRRVLERLVRHHVAPMARGVADGEEDRLVLPASALERLGRPGVPVDGVIGVLPEIRIVSRASRFAMTAVGCRARSCSWKSRYRRARDPERRWPSLRFSGLTLLMATAAVAPPPGVPAESAHRSRDSREKPGGGGPRRYRGDTRRRLPHVSTPWRRRGGSGRWGCPEPTAARRCRCPRRMPSLRPSRCR